MCQPQLMPLHCWYMPTDVDAVLCRTLVNLRLLADQMTPVMHSHRQQLIDQPMQAATTAQAAATAADAYDAVDGTAGTTELIAATAEATAATAEATAATVEATPATAETTAATADAETPAAGTAAETGGAVHGAAGSPFAATDIPLMPTFLGVSIERPGRRQEQSGTLPWDQLFSRNPSPIGSQSSQTLSDRHFSGGLAAHSSGMLPSRLSVENLNEMAPVLFSPGQVTACTTGQHHAAVGFMLDIPSSTAVATAAATETAPLPLPRDLATVFSGQGLESGYSRQASHDSELESSRSPPFSADTQDVESELNSSAPIRPLSRTLLAADEQGAEQAGQEAGNGDSAAESLDDDAVAQLELEAEARKNQAQRQHPWLLYFYDNDMERDYSAYHGRQMVKVSHPEHSSSLSNANFHISLFKCVAFAITGTATLVLGLTACLIQVVLSAWTAWSTVDISHLLEVICLILVNQLFYPPHKQDIH